MIVENPGTQPVESHSLQYKDITLTSENTLPKGSLRLKAVSAALTLVLVACVKLDGLASYATVSAKTMEDQTLVEGIPATVERRNSYRDGGESPLATARDNAKRLEKVQKVYNAYFLALGALAKKDLTEYKSQLSSFEKSLAGSGLATKEDASAINKLLHGAIGIVAEGYRQKTITDLVTTVDPTLQRGMRDMKNINANYRVSLSREDAASQSAMEEMIKAGDALTPPQPPYLARGFRNHQAAVIASAMKRSQAYDKAIDSISRGHSLLARETRTEPAPENRTSG